MNLAEEQKMDEEEIEKVLEEIQEKNYLRKKWKTEMFTRASVTFEFLLQ